MSWDSYVGSMEGEGCCYVGFFDHEGNKWAESKSPEINPTPTQVKKIVDGIRPPRSVNLMAGGISLGDKNLLCVAITDHTAVFKQKGDDASDKVMVCVGCFNQGTVVGVSHAGEREKIIMSWTDYTSRLVESKVELCAIHGKDGAPWAQVPGFSCTPDEVTNVSNAIVKNDSNICGSGALMAGKRWTVIRMDPDVQLIIFKGKDTDNLKQTLVVALTNQAVVLGANKDENVQGSTVVVAVQGMRDYLKQCGY